MKKVVSQKIKGILLAIVLLLAAAQLFGQGTVTGELKKWHKITITFNGPQSDESTGTNPFLDYRLNVTFTNGSSTYIVPGYYAADGNAADTSATSGNKWRVHFTPDKVGAWDYSVSFRQGSGVAVNSSATAGSGVSFDGATGSINIGATDKTGRDLRGKGMLRYVGERYLRFDNGQWFIKGGADSPENFLSFTDFDNTAANKTWAPHAGDWQSGDPTWSSGKGKGIIGAVNYLSSTGCNVFSFLTLSYQGDDKTVFPWIAGNQRTRFDVSKLDQWEIVFEHADKKGMYLHFKTQETENDQLLDGGGLGTERKLYYREVIARFGHHLALNWNIGEENTNTEAQRKQFAAYFKNMDPYNHNIVLHTYPAQKNSVYPALLGSASEYTGASLQSDIGIGRSDVLNWLSQSETAGKKWVVAWDEQGSANNGIKPDASDDHKNERQDVLWGTLTAGGAGVETYFGYAWDHSDLSCNDWRSRDKWWKYVSIAVNFFLTDVPFWEMKNNDTLASGSSNWCLYKTGEAYLVYLKNGGTTTMTLPGGEYTVTWLNPRNGNKIQGSGVSGGSVSFTPPSDTSNDWAVLIKGGSCSNPKSLQVTDGSGSGAYCPGSLVTIRSTPPAGYTLDRWLGDIQYLNSSTTDPAVVTMPNATVTLTASFKPIPAGSDITCYPTDDAFLQGSTLNNINLLRVEAENRIVYFKFDIPAAYVQSAALKLTCTSDSGSGVLRAYLGSHTNWTESNLSLGNAPQKVSELGSINSSYAVGSAYTINLSGITAGGLVTIILEQDTGGNDVAFSSKEGSPKPELQVRTDGAVSTPTPGPTPTPTLQPTPTRQPTATPVSGLPGDVNKSGVVDIVDALMTAQYYVGLNPPGFTLSLGDVNQDGVISIVDALIIAQYYVGLVPSLPV